MKNILAFFGLVGLLLNTTVHAADSDIQQQLKSLQAQIDQLKASHTASPIGDTTIGGYGEAAYNNYRTGQGRDQIDLHRFVLFFGHRFNDQLTFNSEVEWEHAVTSKDDSGESEIEQAYLNYSLQNHLNLKGGLFLMPFGLLNLSHEPPVFYGVERNEVETRIIPSTWREGGVGVWGTSESGWDWDLGVVTGFDIGKFDGPDRPLASSHQELQNARAHDMSYYAALNYRGLADLQVGGAAFLGNSGQGGADHLADPTKPDFAGVHGQISLWEAHARWQHAGLDLQSVYAEGHLGDAAKIDEILAAAGKAPAPEQFKGWLMQAAYNIALKAEMSVAPFLRYEEFDTQARMPSGFHADSANADRVVTGGVSFKPISQVVVKADYQRYKKNSDNDRFNIGLGYMF